ncbi:MAG: LCP family protein [Candidatus Limnocylindrales bacterium]
MQARRIRPDTGPLDRRRLAAAGLSALLPGLGQLVNRRSRLAALFLLPSLLLVLVAGLLWATQTPARLVASIVAPNVVGTLLTLNLLILAWRLVAVGQAFLDTRWAGPTGRLGVGGLIVLSLLVALPHGLVQWYGGALGDTFSRVFETELRGSSGAPVAAPADGERINVLLLGVDRRANHDAILTDTMMVASLDPVGKTVSIVSIPRDLINIPLGNGDDYGPKVNSLMSYADSHRDEFPHGGRVALRQAIGALLGIDIPYYAQVSFAGFRRMVDAVGGVDIVVAADIDDPEFGVTGYRISKGPHHLDGQEALDYVRSRKGKGESDFTRATRQQQVLLALRGAVTSDGSLLWELPDLLDAVADTVRTNVPTSVLPAFAAIADEVNDDAVVRSIIRHPLVRSKDTRYGSSLIPDLDAIRAVAADLFPEPGVAPIPWPSPKP